MNIEQYYNRKTYEKLPKLEDDRDDQTNVLPAKG